MATAVDNLGRKIDVTNTTLGELRSLIGTLMKSKVGDARPMNKGGDERSASIGKMKELLEDYTKDFSKEMKEQQKYLSDVVDNLKDLVNKKEQKSGSKEKPGPKEKGKSSKEERMMTKAMWGLYQHGVVKRNSLAVADQMVHAKLDKVIKSLGSVARALNAGGGIGGGGGKGTANSGSSGNRGGGSSGDNGNNLNEKLDGSEFNLIMFDKMNQILSKIYNFSQDIQKSFLGWDAWTEITQDLIGKEREFTQDIRQIAFETEGVTKESKDLFKAYEQIGKSVAETGKNRTEFQEAYKRALKSGVKDLKVAVSLTKTQLNAETMLGLKAGELGDTFLSWHQSGKMTTSQLNEMSRGLHQAAMNSGLTGEAMKSAVESSKEFVNAMSNAATLTASAASNIIELSAHAKKLGIESQMQPLMKAMASSSNLILESSDQTKNLLYMAANSVGRMKDLTNGTLLKSKGGLKDMAKGMENVLKRFGVDSLEAIDNLSDEAKTKLNLQLKTSVGMELGEFRKAIEATKEAGKGYAERISDIDKKMNDNISTSEKAALAEKQRSLQISNSLSVLTAAGESMQGVGDDMGAALKKFAKRRKEFGEDATTAAMSDQDAMRKHLEDSLKGINEGRKKAGMSEVEINSSEIEKAINNPKAFPDLLDKISQGQKELEIQNKADLDPMTSMAKNLKEINENLRLYTQTVFSRMFDSLIGKVVVVIGVLASILAGLGFLGLRLGGVAANISKLGAKFGIDVGGKVAGAAGKIGAKFGIGGGAAAAQGASGATGFVGSAGGLGSANMSALAASGKGGASTAAGVAEVTAGASKFAGVLGKLGSLFRTIGGFASKAFWPLTLVLGAVEGLANAQETAARADKIFNKNMKDVTLNEEYAAKSAGYLTGFLNSVTFGIAGLLLPLDDWTNWLARFTAEVPILTYFLAGTVIQLEAAWGLVKGIGLAIWEVIKGIGGMIMNIWNPIKEGFTDIGNAIGKIFGGGEGKKTMSFFQKLTNAFRELGGITGIISGAIKALGTALGWVFRIIGKVIGYQIKFYMKLIEGLMVVLEPVAEVFYALWDAVEEVFTGIGDVFEGLMDVGNQIGDTIYDFFKPVIDIFSSGEKGGIGFFDVVKAIGQGLGKVASFSMIYVIQPLMIAAKLLAGIGKVIQAFVKVFKGDIGGAQELIKSAVRGILEAIMWPVKKFFGLFGKSGEDFYKKIMGSFEPAINFLGKFLTFFIELIKNVGTFLFKLVIQPFMIMWRVLTGLGKVIAAVIQFFYDWKAAGENIKKAFWDLVKEIIAPFQYLYDILVGKSIIPDLVEGIISWFLKLPLKVFDGLISMGGKILEGITQPLMGIGKWLFDTFTGVFGKVVDFVLGLIPGGGSIKNASAAFAATEEENRKRVAAEGNSISGGLGRTLGGVTEGSIGKTLGGIGETGGAVLSAVNPFNWFEDGTRQVAETGLGILHKNEMVMPANIVDSLIAQGTGAFGGMGEIGTIASSMFGLPDIQSMIAGDRATTSPSKSEVSSPELGTIAEESSEQTTQLTQLVELFKEVVELLQPGSINRSGGGDAGETAAQTIMHAPANFYRNTVGLVTQTAAKAVLNFGAPNA